MRYNSLEIFLWLILMFLALVWITGCTTPKKSGEPLESLCILDFEDKMCWTNKALKRGTSFEQMRKFQAECSGGLDFPCWYGLTTVDLMRLGK